MRAVRAEPGPSQTVRRTPDATSDLTHSSVRPLDVAIRVIPSAWFQPDPRIYWTDLLVSAAIGWTAFAAGVVARPLAARAALLIVASFALYRAALFIHEITHLTLRDVPAFRTGWNALVGVPLLLPSFLYEGVHTDHHRQHSYGTPADPEYVPFGRRPPGLIVSYAAVSLLLPLLLVVRFGILAPLSWVIPSLRRLTVARFSALVINHQYVRRAPIDRAAVIEEAAATAVCVAVVGLWYAGVLPGGAILAWLAVSAIASAVNVVRTLAAHLYDHDVDHEISMVSQLLDTCTITPSAGAAGRLSAAWRALWAPVGLRYHALHHWIPSLPYHNLGRAHRRLLSTLGADAPYVATQHPAIAPVVRNLVRRASRTRAATRVS